MKNLNRPYRHNRATSLRKVSAACQKSAQALGRLLLVRRVILGNGLSLSSVPDCKQAILAELLTSCTLLSVRDGYTIGLRLQCGHSRCGRKGLAECATIWLGYYCF